MIIKDLADLEIVKECLSETDLVSEDIEITCRDCSKTFIFTSGEQEFYKSKSFPFPKRCHSCAKERRRKFLNYK